jgi:hypothetical protein
MKIEDFQKYDILQPTGKGNATMTKKWIEENMGIDNPRSLFFFGKLDTGVGVFFAFDPSTQTLNDVLEKIQASTVSICETQNENAPVAGIQNGTDNITTENFENETSQPQHEGNLNG